jgi:hypothetical protein
MTTKQRKRHTSKPAQKATPLTVEWQEVADIGKEFQELADLEAKVEAEAEAEAEPFDTLTDKQRLVEIKTLSDRIVKGEQTADDLQEKIAGAGDMLRTARHVVSGLYWRLGKLLEIEKPLHPKKWMEWYQGIGLDKDQVSTALKTAKRWKSQGQAQRHSVRDVVKNPKSALERIESRLASDAKWFSAKATLAAIPKVAKSKKAILAAVDTLAQALAQFRKAVAGEAKKDAA